MSRESRLVQVEITAEQFKLHNADIISSVLYYAPDNTKIVEVFLVRDSTYIRLYNPKFKPLKPCDIIPTLSCYIDEDEDLVADFEPFMEAKEQDTTVDRYSFYLSPRNMITINTTTLGNPIVKLPNSYVPVDYLQKLKARLLTSPYVIKTECAHNWQTYEGLLVKYDFCTICNEKR